MFSLLVFAVLLTPYLLVQAKQLPNFVIILTDDQDSVLNGMLPMLRTKSLLGEMGATFTNAYTTTPLCCPSRSSILSGLYLHNHHVVNNSISGGCSGRAWQTFHEPFTFASKLQNIGYSTFYAGKYLNKYGSKKVGGFKHIPPGWSEWIGLIGNSKYYNYTLSYNGNKQHFKHNYLTRLLRYYSKNFINHIDRESPFLVMIAPPAPHAPFTPEPKYDGHYKDEKIPRTKQFNTCNNKDKHWLARMGPSPLSESTINLLDGCFGKRLESLLSVDDLVESVVHSLINRGFINNTYIIFTSDNGYHLGQFSMPLDKRQPYEFDIKIPLIIRGPGIPKNITISAPALLMDIAPTILNLVGLETNHLDGQPLIPVESISHNEGGRAFLIEYHGEKEERKGGQCWPHDDNVHGCLTDLECKCQDSRNNTYNCLKIVDSETDFIFCKFDDDDDFQEAYDLKFDPYQMTNIAYDLRISCKLQLINIMEKMRYCRGSECSLFDNRAFNIVPHCFL